MNFRTWMHNVSRPGNYGSTIYENCQTSPIAKVPNVSTVFHLIASRESCLLLLVQVVYSALDWF